MIVRNFLQWAQKASAAQRADGAAALARAFLYSDFDTETLHEAELALTSLLDDASPLVRHALAESFASAADAPHSIVAALAYDQSDVAAPVLSRSPLLTDAELIDCAAIGGPFAQNAIALRAHVSAGVSAALAEVGAREAAISLLGNPGAEVPEFSLRRLIERFGSDGEMREAMLARPFLPAAIRTELVSAAAAALTAFVVDCAWITKERAARLSREARDKANVLIVSETAERCGRQGVLTLTRHLCAAGALTPNLLLRALLCGDRDLFEAALIELSGVSEDRTAGLLRDFQGAGFAALYIKAGLPEKFFLAFRAVLEAQGDAAKTPTGGGRLSLDMIRRVLSAVEEMSGEGLDKLTALLRRFEAEAALEEAREYVPLLLGQANEETFPFAPVIDMAALEAEIFLAA